ncbi:hypothetical protein BKA82DRAFT_4138420 [Pisolithus tinctorius]|nr:hypothetical protein BKA82DRAFT_4138420 [Pisolithus tinctorius]
MCQYPIGSTLFFSCILHVCFRAHRIGILLLDPPALSWFGLYKKTRTHWVRNVAKKNYIYQSKGIVLPTVAYTTFPHSSAHSVLLPIGVYLPIRESEARSPSIRTSRIPNLCSGLYTSSYMFLLCFLFFPNINKIHMHFLPVGSLLSALGGMGLLIPFSTFRLLTLLASCSMPFFPSSFLNFRS